MIVAFTGIRQVDATMADAIKRAVLEEIASGATELRFGGALGSDTIALEAAWGHGVKCVVYVPFLVRDQPKDARAVIEKCADSVIELQRRKWTKSAYFERNRAMINGADRLVAFTDGREGGTAFTIREAKRLGIQFAIVPVLGTGSRAKMVNP